MWCHSFLNVKLFLSFYLAFRPPPSPRLANVQNWYFIFLDRLLRWKNCIQWEEKEGEIEPKQGAFRERLFASDVTAGPLAANQANPPWVPMR